MKGTSFITILLFIIGAFVIVSILSQIAPEGSYISEILGGITGSTGTDSRFLTYCKSYQNTPDEDSCVNSVKTVSTKYPGEILKISKVQIGIPSEINPSETSFYDTWAIEILLSKRFEISNGVIANKLSVHVDVNDQSILALKVIG